MYYLINQNDEILKIRSMSDSQFDQEALIKSDTRYSATLAVQARTPEQVKDDHIAQGFREISKRGYLERLQEILTGKLSEVSAELFTCPEPLTVVEIFDIAA